MKKIIFYSILSVFVLASCQKNITSLNIDTKNPPSAPSYALFTNGQKNLVDYITTPNVNSNIFTLIAQYWTEATYTDESNYNLGNRNIPQNFWNNLYVGALNNFQQAKLLIPTDVTDPAVVKNELEITENGIKMKTGFQKASKEFQRKILLVEENNDELHRKLYTKFLA
ncbi:SusD/RagB family nutrient-binding outer membrane lipoprotein [Hydrotalea sp.]|uniref:SusD/RagB family nutrient-binding outer membrane lipoprotein n=1 Tax=Hydrotalea sp. TaxID=2881279 RepID=UPI002607162D|nr:SusD/RagB family nutrient-binding outer membrane lipoprotein [Hydrotalea sp.]